MDRKRVQGRESGRAEGRKSKRTGEGCKGERVQGRRLFCRYTPSHSNLQASADTSTALPFEAPRPLQASHLVKFSQPDIFISDLLESAFMVMILVQG